MNNAPNEMMALQTVTPGAPTVRTSSSALMLDSSSMDKMLRVAEVMAMGRSTIPKHLQSNVGDCMAVVMQATQWNMNPFAVAQKTHVVNGTLGYEAQLVAAVINNSGIVKDRFNFEWFGDWHKIIGKFKEVTSSKKLDDNGQPKKFIVPAWEQKDEHGLGVRVWATIRGESEPRTLDLLMTQARTRNSTLWTEDPKQQLAYLAQKRWSRLHAPDVILGVYTPDELDDRPPINMGTADVVATPAAAPVDDGLLAEAEAAARTGMATYQHFWKSITQEQRKSLAGEHEGLKATAKAADEDRTLDSAPTFPPVDNPATAAAAPAAKTFEEIMAMICAAKTEDALYVAGDWINTITDQEQAALLNAKFDEVLGTVRGAA